MNRTSPQALEAALARNPRDVAALIGKAEAIDAHGIGRAAWSV